MVSKLHSYVKHMRYNSAFTHVVDEIPRQGRLEGCHRMSAAAHLLCGLEGVS